MTVHTERNLRPIRAIAPLGLIALAALAVGCGSPDVTPVADVTTTVTATSTAAPSQPTAQPPAPPQPTTTITVTATPAPPAPNPAPVPVPIPVPDIRPAIGPFQSPSGNIQCTMFTHTDGQNEARCEVAVHNWQAPPRNDICQLDWGSRFELPQDGRGGFACYNSNLPAPQETLAYGQGRQLGTLVCISQPSAMTCTDTATGHFFRVSRETYDLG